MEEEKTLLDLGAYRWQPCRVLSLAARPDTLHGQAYRRDFPQHGKARRLSFWGVRGSTFNHYSPSRSSNIDRILQSSPELAFATLLVVVTACHSFSIK